MVGADRLTEGGKTVRTKSPTRKIGKDFRQGVAGNMENP